MEEDGVGGEGREGEWAGGELEGEVEENESGWGEDEIDREEGGECEDIELWGFVRGMLG